MIVKIDVNDNDFAETVYDCLNKYVQGIGFITDDYFSAKMKQVVGKDNEKSLIAYKEYSIARDEIREYLMYGDEDNKQYDLKLIKKYLKEGIMYLLKDSFSKENYNYLKQSIEISFPKSMKCQWENGEVIYYIPNTYSKNKLLLF